MSHSSICMTPIFLKSGTARPYYDKEWYPKKPKRAQTVIKLVLRTQTYWAKTTLTSANCFKVVYNIPSTQSALKYLLYLSKNLCFSEASIPPSTSNSPPKQSSSHQRPLPQGESWGNQYCGLAGTKYCECGALAGGTQNISNKKSEREMQILTHDIQGYILYIWDVCIFIYDVYIRIHV